MSQHPSLRSKSKGVSHRSVLKRYERLKELKGKEKWDDEQSVFGLPKLKILKFKIKKEKAAEAEVQPAVGAETPVTAGSQTAQADASKMKKEAPKKEAAPKPEAKGKEKK